MENLYRYAVAGVTNANIEPGLLLLKAAGGSRYPVITQYSVMSGNISPPPTEWSSATIPSCWYTLKVIPNEVPKRHAMDVFRFYMYARQLSVPYPATLESI